MHPSKILKIQLMETYGIRIFFFFPFLNIISIHHSRCTGYRPILESIKILAESKEKHLPKSFENFPEELKEKESFQKTIEIESENGKRILTYSFDELLDLKEQHPQSKILAGNTEIGIEQRFQNAEYSVLISPMQIKEIKFITHNEEYLQVGSLTTLTEMLNYLNQIYKNDVPNQKNGIETNLQRGVRPLIRQLYYFSGTSIR